MKHETMKVEIWSDVTCNFCYTAKRKFENALSQFKERDKIEVIWKSFELAPGLKTDANKKFPHFLAELRSISLEQAKGMIDHVTNAAREAGLAFNLEEAIPANSFNAHRLSHLAREQGLQTNAKEKLFAAYFTEGKNIDDISTLIDLADEIGLDRVEVKNMLQGTKYANEVRQDIDEAKQAGIRSVPHYVFNGKTKLSGAQDSTVYLETLSKTFAQWQRENEQTQAETGVGLSCKIGEICD